jgi:4-amino-4-deoxy-L-arabinose transferase-like glycosyltransferase
MTETPNLRDRLLSASSVDPGLREQYESELKAIIHRQLRPAERWLYGLLALAGLLFAVVFGIATVRLKFLDVTFSLMCAAISIYCVVAGVRLAMIVRRGRLDRRKSTKWRIGVVYYVVVIGFWFACVFRSDKIGISGQTLILMFLPILTGLIIFCAGWIAHLIAQAELRGREEILEIKLQLAAMSKELGRDDK